MSVQTPPPTIQQKPVAPPPIFMIGGGQKEVTEDDLKEITFSVKVNIECKNDEREVTAVVPIYEHCLLSRIWSRIGGEARLVADWLPTAAKYPRVVKLSRDMLRDEIRRLEETYKTHLPNGTVRSHFKDIYGRDGDPIAGFYRVINKQVRAWHELQAKIRNGHRLIAEDLLAISNIANPEAHIASPDEITDFSDVSIEEGGSHQVMEGEIDADPLADMMDFLSARNWSADVIMDLSKLLGDGENVTQVKVNSLPSLHGKRGEQLRLMTDFKAFIAHTEKKTAAEEKQKAATEAEKLLQNNV